MDIEKKLLRCCAKIAKLTHEFENIQDPSIEALLKVQLIKLSVILFGFLDDRNQSVPSFGIISTYVEQWSFRREYTWPVPIMVNDHLVDFEIYCDVLIYENGETNTEDEAKHAQILKKLESDMNAWIDGLSNKTKKMDVPPAASNQVKTLGNGVPRESTENINSDTSLKTSDLPEGSASDESVNPNQVEQVEEKPPIEKKIYSVAQLTKICLVTNGTLQRYGKPALEWWLSRGQKGKMFTFPDAKKIVRAVGEGTQSTTVEKACMDWLQSNKSKDEIPKSELNPKISIKSDSLDTD